MTVDAVKRKLISHTGVLISTATQRGVLLRAKKQQPAPGASVAGTNPSAMVLQLFNDANGLVATLSDDARKLGFYSPLDGWRLHVIDTDPTSVSANGWLEDVSKVTESGWLEFPGTGVRYRRADTRCMSCCCGHDVVNPSRGPRDPGREVHDVGCGL